MRSIFLIGFMGAGKTAAGRVLAGRLQRVFIDLDEAIEDRAGMSIAEIFATLGEGAFRRDLELHRGAVIGDAVAAAKVRLDRKSVV